MLKVIPHMTYCQYPISYLRAHRANQGHLRADLFLAPAVAAIFLFRIYFSAKVG
jgi:hypothetical protein